MVKSGSVLSGKQRKCHEVLFENLKTHRNYAWLNWCRPLCEILTEKLESLPVAANSVTDKLSTVQQVLKSRNWARYHAGSIVLSAAGESLKMVQNYSNSFKNDNRLTERKLFRNPLCRINL